MDFTTEQIDVCKNVFWTVDYAFEYEDGKVTIWMRCNGNEIAPIEVFGPLVIDNAARALVLVSMWAKWIYDDQQAAEGRPEYEIFKEL